MFGDGVRGCSVWVEKQRIDPAIPLPRWGDAPAMAGVPVCTLCFVVGC